MKKLSTLLIERTIKDYDREHALKILRAMKDNVVLTVEERKTIEDFEDKE